MFLELQIIISEGSCDTEDWSNDALITGINYLSQYNQIKTVILNCNYILQNDSFSVFLIKGNFDDQNRCISKH